MTLVIVICVAVGVIIMLISFAVVATLPVSKKEMQLAKDRHENKVTILNPAGITEDDRELARRILRATDDLTKRGELPRS